ncbi:MAG: di-heme-cytochrome C peroxidase [Polyangiales bacterium]
MIARSHLSRMLLLAWAWSGCRSGSAIESEPLDRGDPIGGQSQTALATPLPILLDQGWDQRTREAFWFTPQGSQVMPYSWFLSLERADSQELVRASANMERYRYISMPPSELNPDALPIGFVRDVDVESRTASLGLTCAACHTAKISLNGRDVIIDGGPTLSDFKAFLRDTVEALAATRRDPSKFQRFAASVLPVDAGDAERAELRQALSVQHDALAVRLAFDGTEVEPGYGRLDAFGGILNNVAATGLGLPANAAPQDAPVSYPFVWDAPQADRVQWNGSALNAPLVGALTRNIGEVLGVFGRLELDPKLAKLRGYSNSVNLPNLGRLENWLRELSSPRWPRELLPAIDGTLASAGEQLYGEHCASCHERIDARDPARKIAAKMVPVPEVGTDPTMARNYLDRKGKTGKLEGKRAMILGGERFGAETRTFQIVANGVAGVLLDNPLESLAVALGDLNHVRKLRKEAPMPTPRVDDAARAMAELKRTIGLFALFDPDTYHYKARPLNGVWATAPYLHNGSVPSLWDLLQTPAQRPKAFHVGSRSFDAKKMGMSTAAEPGTSLLDTGLHGNSNAGHLYGTQLSEAQKWQLIEYVKTL